MTTTETKTPKELTDLIAQWKADPCWDIEDTEGFEQYKDSLKLLRIEYHEKCRKDEEMRLMRKAFELGCTVEVLKYIEDLERQIKKLSEAVVK